MLHITHHFIGGHRVAPQGSDLFEVRSPFDGALVGTVPAATPADIDLAVSAARQAFDTGPWPRLLPSERQTVLQKFSALHAANANEIATLISRENGTPISGALMLQQGIVPQNQAYLDAAASFPWEERRPAFIKGETIWRREPLGVVAAIIPWNAPQQSALVKLFPALLAGCSVVLKLAPETGLDGHLLGELFNEAGLPEGVLSILTAERETSEYLVRHPGVDKIAFTGSTGAGKRIASLAGESLKRVSLELGGKSAAIILPDVDIAATAAAIQHSAYMNNGQACIAHTRVLVPATMHDRFVDALAKVVNAIKVGDPSDPATMQGPLVAKRQQERVWGFIESGIAEGARLAAGGLGMPEGLTEGAFVSPTLFANVNNSMRIAQEEIFGPVVCVIPYQDLDDAISIANDSPYGLSGGVWTHDESKAIEIARQMRTGTVSINGQWPDFRAPFGGYKQSGIGREFGSEGIAMYVEHKVINL
ncbi:aldehyde dehydrogenase [Aeromonas tecta]|uniref:aldehyde dehydrogenase n=1 Tax=Aeromonas tecta TaxID=324617 RepID=UPI0006818958|nr:aldehyde dehydrogenase [Aeromonas tecta]